MMDENGHWYARPVFFVGDCEASLGFYERLGFTEEWRHEESGDLLVVQVSYRGCEIILNRNAERSGGGRLFLSLAAGQVRSFVETLVAAGVSVADGNWGMPVKIIRDPDGNDLLLYDDELSK